MATKKVPVIQFLSALAVVVLVLFSAATGNAERPEKRLSLANCIDLAIQHATSAKKAESKLKLQGADVMRSYGNFLPRISVSAGYTPYTLNRSYLPDNPVTDIQKTTRKSADLTVTTSLNLFNGFRDYAALQSALKMEQAAHYTLARTVESVVFDVTQAYFQHLLDRELFDIARENLLSTEDQLALTERQFKLGLKSLIDRNQQKADTEQSRLVMIKAETQRQRSMIELVRRLGIDTKTTVTLVPEPEELKITPDLKPPPDIDSLITIALERRNDMKSSNLETKAAEWQLSTARAAWYPTIEFNFTVTSGGTEYLNHEYAYPPLSEQLAHTVGYSANLRLNWVLFDGFQTRYGVQGAKINLMNQQLDDNDLRDNIILDLQQAAAEYTSAFTRIETAKVSFTAAQSAFKSVKRKYELGAASFVELSAARAMLFNSQSNLSQATYNLALQKSVLDFIMGNAAKP